VPELFGLLCRPKNESINRLETNCPQATLETPLQPSRDLLGRPAFGKAIHYENAKSGVGPRLPKWVGFLAGNIFDFLAHLTNRKFPASSIRVKKFPAFSCFSSAKYTRDRFTPQFSIEHGLARTLQTEFISHDINREIFYTE
jgi:hypothetical protein